jgi:hypothetical protein
VVFGLLERGQKRQRGQIGEKGRKGGKLKDQGSKIKDQRSKSKTSSKSKVPNPKPFGILILDLGFVLIFGFWSLDFKMGT